MHLTKTTRALRGPLALASSGVLAALALSVAVAPSASAADPLPCRGQTFDTPLTAESCTIAPGETLNFTLSASYGGAGGNNDTFSGGMGGLGGVVSGTYTNTSDAEELIGALIAGSGEPGTYGPIAGTNGTGAGTCSIFVQNGANPGLIASVAGGAGGDGATPAGPGLDGLNGTLQFPALLPDGWTFETRGFAPSVSFTAATTAILLTGSRSTTDPVRIEVIGETTGLVGATVTPYVKLQGQEHYTMGTGVRTVDADGAFTWSRKSKHKTYVYFKSGSTKSTSVVIAKM